MQAVLGRKDPVIPLPSSQRTYLKRRPAAQIASAVAVLVACSIVFHIRASEGTSIRPRLDIGIDTILIAMEVHFMSGLA